MPTADVENNDTFVLRVPSSSVSTGPAANPWRPALKTVDLSVIEGGRIVRTPDDLPPPVGNVYTLDPGLWIPVGTVALPVGHCIDVPAGSTLSCLGYQAASITGSHASGIIKISGGAVQNLFLSNANGGAYAAEIQFVGGTNAYVSDAVLFGAGPGIVADDVTSGALTCFNVLHDTSGGSTRSYVVKTGSTTIIGLITCYASNGGAAVNYRGLEIEAGATILDGLLVTNTVFFGGSADGAAGIKVDGTVPNYQITGCTFVDFDGVGAAALSGFSNNTPTAVINGTFPRNLDTRPGGNISLSAGVPPSTTTTLANTWYPITATGAALTADASLVDTPADGQIRYVGEFDAPMSLRGAVSLEKTGAAQVRTLIRLELSSDNGATWSAVGSESRVDVTDAASEYVSFGDHVFLKNERVRLAISSASAGTVYSTLSYTVGIR